MLPYIFRCATETPPTDGPVSVVDGSVELEQISDYPTGLEYSHHTGMCRPEKDQFASPLDGNFGDVKRLLDRGRDSISSRGGAASTYEP